MLKRRNIRETAVQFLYFTDLEGGVNTAETHEAFWEMAQETSLKKLNAAKVKAILHVTQGRTARVAKLSERAPAYLATLKAANNAEPLRVLLNKIILKEHKFDSIIETLKVGSTSQTDDLMQLNQNLLQLRKQWLMLLEDFPSWKNKLEEITAIFLHLQKISERLAAIDDPDSSLTDFAHLHASASEISIFRKETQSLVDNVISHLETIDKALNKTIENYSPSRVDPVDRAILRIAAYEIQHCDDIPRAVSINEAIEIGKRFGTNGSAKFINGVLDAL